MKKILQFIFSVTNIGNHKIITILGIKLKFKRKNQLIKIDDSSLLKLKSILKNTYVQIDKNNFREIEKICENILKKFFDYKPSQNNVLIETKDFSDISILKEVIENTCCPFCQSTDYYVSREFKIADLIIKYKNIYKIDPIGSVYSDKILYKYHCNHCGLEFYNYKIPDTSLFYEKLLESGRYNYPKYKWEYNKAIEVIKKYNCKRVLDIGCGYGFFLEKIQHMTEYVLGLEFNKNALDECKRKCLNVSDANLDEIKEKFDCICLFQVLEHIQEPKSFLEKIIKLLNDGGILFIGTPNPEGLWIKSNPDILNLPPHHCLDVTREFYENLPEFFHNVKFTDYFQDEPEFNLYQNYYFPTKVNKTFMYLSRTNIYGYYLQEKSNLLGHRHICIYQKG